MKNIENEINESTDQKKHEDDIYKKLCHFLNVNYLWMSLIK